MGKPVGALEVEKKGERPSDAVCVCVCVCVCGWVGVRACAHVHTRVCVCVHMCAYALDLMMCTITYF